MHDFKRLMWKRGLQLLLAVIIIVIFIFLLNFFFPKIFKFSDPKAPNSGVITNNSAEVVNNDPSSQNTSLSYKIYNALFRWNRYNIKPTNEYTEPQMVDEEGNIISKPERGSVWNSTTTTVWGEGASSTAYGGQNFYKLNVTDAYIYPNTKNSIVQKLKINGTLVSSRGYNILPRDALITGEISSGYIVGYFLSLDVYDSAGDYLYSIPSSSVINAGNNISSFIASNSRAYNYMNYKGDGFVVIRSDNPVVEGLLMFKVKIEN